MRGALAAVAIAVVGCILPSLAREVNITIDDTFGDPMTGQLPLYNSAVHAKWRAHTGSGQATCDERKLNLDATQAFKSTWHDLSAAGAPASSLSFQFRGTAVYIYCILANNIVEEAVPDTRLAFFLDGQLVGTFTDVGNRSTEAPAFRYHQLVYASGNLSNTVHSFVLSRDGRGRGGSVVLFDYAIYTAQDKSCPESVVRASAGNVTRDAHSASVSEDEVSPTGSSSLVSSVTYGSRGHEGSPRMEGLLAQPVPPPNADHPVTIGLIVVSIAAALAYLAGLLWYCNRRRKKQESQMRQLEPQPLTLPPLSLPALAHHSDSTVRPYPMFIPPALGMLAAASAVQSYGHSAVARSAGLTPGMAAAASMSSVAAKYASISKGRAVLPQPEAPTEQNSQLQEELAQLREEVEILRARDDPPPGYDDSLMPGPSRPAPSALRL